MRPSKALKASLLVLVMMFVGVLTARTVLAGTGQIYVSPGTASVVNQSNVTVALRINPGNAVNAVQFTLSWDSSKLKYVSLDTSQSAFGTGLAQSLSASSITSIRGVSLPVDGTSSAVPVSGDSLIATVTFQALAGSGSTGLNLTNSNANAADGSYTNPAMNSGTVNFNSPAPAPAPAPTTSPGTTPPNMTAPTSTSPSTTKPTTNTPTTSTTGPTAANTTPPGAPSIDVAAGNVQFNTASVALKTSVPTQVYIKYGVGDQLNSQTALSELAASHDIDLTAAGLVPGNTYSYQIVAKDAGGTITQSAVKTFKTKGFTLRVTMLDKENKPLKKSEIVLRSEPQKLKTDSNGVAEFTGVAPGNHHVYYTSGGKEYSQAIAVDNNIVTNAATGAQTAALQNVAVKLPVNAATSFPVFLPILLLLTAAAAVAVYTMRDKLNIPARFQAQTAGVGQSVAVPAPLSQYPASPALLRPTKIPTPGSVVAPRDIDDHQGNVS